MREAVRDFIALVVFLCAPGMLLALAAGAEDVAGALLLGLVVGGYLCGHARPREEGRLEGRDRRGIT